MMQKFTKAVLQQRMVLVSQRSFVAAPLPARSEKDYYTILNVPASATPEQIKEAYRNLAKKHHPDVRSSD